MLYGDEYGPLIEEGCLRLDIDDMPVAGLVIVFEKETQMPLITYAMTSRLNKRNGCISLLMRLAFSAMKMNGFNECDVCIDEQNIPAMALFKSFGFEAIGQT